MKTIDNAGNERELEHVGTFRDGVELYREVGGTGVVADNADGIRLCHDAESYVDALPEWDRAEAAELLGSQPRPAGFYAGQVTIAADFNEPLQPENAIGWNTPDGTAPAGYNVSDYFRDGKYLGPDEDGIAPIFATEGGR